MRKIFLNEKVALALVANATLQYEKLISSFAEKENQSKVALQRATLEYNARLKYMSDCVKHAYQSIQFAANAINPEDKGANYGN